MNKKKRSEVLAFFWFIVSVLLFLALWSYTPDDVIFEASAPNDPAQNFAGVVGAYVAWCLNILFGHVSYFFVPIFIFWGVAKWSGYQGQKPWLRIFSTLVFFSSACALFSLMNTASDITRFGAGGIVGYFAGNFLANFFGSAGIFVALSLFLLSILLASELLVLQIAMGIFKRLRKWFSRRWQKQLAARERSTPAFGKKEVPRRRANLMDQLAPKIKLPKLKKKEAGEPEKLPDRKPEIKVTLPKAPSPGKAPEKPAPEPAPIVSDTPATEYHLPSAELLETPPPLDHKKLKGDLEESSKILEDTLRDFGIEVKVVQIEQGPTITRYELQPAAGVKVQKITALENDIALAMRATSVRIVAPIPGKSLVGIEVPSSANATVYLKEVIESAEYQRHRSKITLGLGKDIGGTPLVFNLSEMPHLLIAGATNTGKSVCINSIISSILFKASPEDVRFLMIDPKMVELHFYNHLPHLIAPVVTDKSKAPAALNWVVSEMDRRYKVLSKVGARNITIFNEKVAKKEIEPASLRHTPENEEEAVVVKHMPYIIVVIDELADLMITSAQEVEGAITRIAQLARAVGIHMILATQRPSVDVVTGVIKANFPARIAFQVASKVDSRTVLDENGADKLLGRGDMLFMDPRKSKLVRAQGAWVQDKEIEKVTQFIKNQRKPLYHDDVIKAQAKKQSFGEFKRDEIYEEAKNIVLQTGQASVSMVQRRLGVGYTRAARLIDMMEEDGIVGPYRGAKPREILVERPGKNSGDNQASGKEA